MNIMHLKYATEIAKTGSLNKAAENLFMGQPNLSRAIKDLETDLGITIFERSAKGMVATPEGEEFLQYASKILLQIEEVESIYKQKRSKKQHFSISVPRASYISEAFARFSGSVSKTDPVEFIYKETNTSETIKNVLQSEYRLGVIRYAENFDRTLKDSLDEKGLTYELITEFTYVLLLNRAHPLAGKEEVRYADLSPYLEIAHAADPLPALSASAARREELPAGTDRRIFVFERASQFELLSENTDAYMWVSPVPGSLLERFGLTEKVCSDNKRIYKDVLIYRKDYRLTALDKRFITELCNSRRRYLPG